MSSYRQILYQIVFRTKSNKHALTEEHCDELYKYISGIIKNKYCTIYRLNGVSDHIHIVCDLHPSVALADLLKDIKIASNIWMKNSGKFPDFNGWSDGYGAFTYSIKEKDRLIEYVKNQKEHHKTFTFMDEFRKLLIKHGIEFDEKYL
ncbi:MAG: IS200/IS605 family transposase [Bacteroidia bacterium]|nr:IS200/IS605 family transposase [Bacteroidia bacterium]